MNKNGNYNTVKSGIRTADRETRVIPINTHNILDYVIGALLVAAPFVFDFNEIERARNVFLTIGSGLIAYSLFTNYKYALVRVIPLGIHMCMDALAGVALMIAPWIFDYNDLLTNGQIAVHFVLGVGAIALVVLTRSKVDEDVDHRNFSDKRAA